MLLIESGEIGTNNSIRKDQRVLYHQSYHGIQNVWEPTLHDIGLNITNDDIEQQEHSVFIHIEP